MCIGGYMSGDMARIVVLESNVEYWQDRFHEVTESANNLLKELRELRQENIRLKLERGRHED